MVNQCRSIHPLSIEAISPTRRLDPSYRGVVPSIHPLSIEAISPTQKKWTSFRPMYYVSILCQSRLFLLRIPKLINSGHSPEYPSSVNRGYFSYVGRKQSEKLR